MNQYFTNVRFVGSIVVASIKGGVHHGNLKDIQKEFGDIAKDHNITHVVFDFKDLTGGDSAAVAGLVDLLKELRNRRDHLVKEFIEGEVKTAPKLKLRGKKRTASFVLSPSRLYLSEKSPQKSIKICGDIQVFLRQPGILPDHGDHVLLRGRIKKPRPPLNPGQFDYRKYLLERRIYAVVEGLGPSSIQKWERKSGQSF